MRERIGTTLETLPWLVAERDGAVAGYAYAGPHRSRAAYRWSADVSVYVGEVHRERGVGRGLYRALLAVLRLQGFFNAYAGIALPNPASVGLHELMGFERVGVYESVGYKHGEWHDVGWWAKTLQDHDDDPEPPRALAGIEGTDEFAEVLSLGGQRETE